MKSTSPENNNEKKISQPVEITTDGSLGILALGAVGIKAWKKKRAEQESTEKKNQQNG